MSNRTGIYERLAAATTAYKPVIEALYRAQSGAAAGTASWPLTTSATPSENRRFIPVAARIAANDRPPRGTDHRLAGLRHDTYRRRGPRGVHRPRPLRRPLRGVGATQRRPRSPARDRLSGR